MSRRRRTRARAIGFDVGPDGQVIGKLRRAPRVVAGDDAPRSTPGPGKKGPIRQVTDVLVDDAGKSMRQIAEWLAAPFDEFERVRKRNGAIAAGVLVVGTAWLVSRVTRDIREGFGPRRK